MNRHRFRLPHPLSPFLAILLMMVFAAFHLAAAEKDPTAPLAEAPGKKILWIDSYHQGYEWSDGIEKGIREALKGAGVGWRAFHMEAKSCPDAACMEAAGIRAKVFADQYEPDILIASDDIAQRYLILPYYKGTGMPVVFCGVNWDASVYGYPTSNITGMVEVDLVEETVKNMRRFGAGDRVGYMSGDTVSDRKIIDFLNRRFFNGKMHAVRVRTFAEFRSAFQSLQESVDMIFLRNYANIDGWETDAAIRFLSEKTRIPTGSNNDFMAPFVLFTLGKIPEEQGIYAARTALEILSGKMPGEIPVERNRQARLTVNLRIAKSAGILLPVSLLKTARVIGKDAYQGILLPPSVLKNATVIEEGAAEVP